MKKVHVMYSIYHYDLRTGTNQLLWVCGNNIRRITLLVFDQTKSVVICDRKFVFVLNETQNFEGLLA